MKIADKEIAEITTAILTAAKDGETGRTTYLRTLIAATQEELGSKKGQEPLVQLAALTTTHERFYAIALDAAQPFVPKTQKDRGEALHARLNFARTAVSALRGHVRAGGDVATLSPAKATKRGLLKATGPKRPLTPKRWHARAENQSKALMATLMGLADADKGLAVEEIQLVMGQLSAQLVSMGLVATKDAVQAAGEHRPLKVGRMLFMPTQTQVIRQMAKPS